MLAVYDASDEADVQLGNFRLKLPMKRMELRQKAVKEAKDHVRHSADWMVKLGDGTAESHDRIQNAVDDLWRYTGENPNGSTNDIAGVCSAGRNVVGLALWEMKSSRKDRKDFRRGIGGVGEEGRM